MKTSLARGAALIVAGVLGLVAFYGLTPLLSPEPAAAIAAGGQNERVQASGNEDSRASFNRVKVGARQAAENPAEGTDVDPPAVRRMLREHMGLTEGEADQLAEDMTEMMSAMHGDQADEMLEACAAQGSASGDSAGGMMGGSPGGMMGGSSGGMMGGGSGGMMGGGSGGMMGF